MPTALIITTAGINCDRELGVAFELAGATPRFVHLNRLMADPAMIDSFDLIGMPGGFSYGDAIAAGRVAAVLMRRTLYAAFVRAIERGVPIIAPCNGFQIAAQMGLLPGPAPGEPWPDEPPTPTITLARNASARFVDRWCRVEFDGDSPCIWTQEVDAEESLRLLPIAHGEGRVVFASDDVRRRVHEQGQVAVRYAADDNPNGSTDDIAGICDASGLVLGLMPHPERYTRWTQHPFWTRLDDGPTIVSSPADPPGLHLFRRAVAHATHVAV